MLPPPPRSPPPFRSRRANNGRGSNDDELGVVSRGMAVDREDEDEDEDEDENGDEDDCAYEGDEREVDNAMNHSIASLSTSYGKMASRPSIAIGWIFSQMM